MASITGTSSTSSSGLSSASTIRGYGGLASGLDRDSLIESMTYATRAKIAAQKQQQQTLTWTQEALRNITSKAYALTNKYMSYSSSSNLTSSKLFSKSQITAVGENAKYLSVSGTSTSSDTFSVLGVKSLAQDAQMTSNAAVSSQALQTSEMSTSLGDDFTANVIAGDTFYIKYGVDIYSVTLPKDSEFNYSDPSMSATENAAAAINKAMESVQISGGKTLNEVMNIEADGDKLTFKSTDTSGNTIQLTGATGSLLQDLGFLKDGESISSLDSDRTVISSSGLTGVADAKITETKTAAQALSGKKISFSYNGTVKQITLDEYKDTQTMDDVQKDLQSKLNDAFGKGRIQVNLDKNADGTKASVSLKTTLPNSGGLDSSSVLSITSADAGIMGTQGLFGIPAGTSNRLNLTASLAESGISRSVTEDTSMIIKNGDTEINLMDEEYGLTWDSSVSEIIKTINGIKDLGITVSYQSETDRFIVKSNEQGASGSIDLSGNLAETLFGTTSDNTVTKGQDAVMLIKYAGSGQEMEVTRGSNNISIDGLSVNVKGTFGYDADGNRVASTEAVTFNAQVDVENTTKVVKEMIDSYNELLTLIHDEMSQKPDRDYSPLTDEQKEDMTDKQIEKWETEAKKGLLFNDTDVTGFADSLRFLLPTGVRSQFEEMGISVSSSYSDNGKLVFDEDKFKAALEKDPNAVKDAFTAQVTTNADGSKTQGGLMTNMKTIMDRYCGMTGATKGVLVTRAGSSYAPTTVLSNSIQKQLDDIDDYLDRLQDKLESEQDRYISQFTSLETLISNMNSQSSYLSSMFS